MSNSRYGKAGQLEVVARWSLLGAEEHPQVGQRCQDFYDNPFTIEAIEGDQITIWRKLPIVGKVQKRITLGELRSWYLMLREP